MSCIYKLRLASLLAALLPIVLPGVSSAADDTLYATLEFSGYWGIGGANNRSVAVDPAGNVYMSGGAAGPDWPTTDGSTHQGGSSDVAIAKFSPEGKLIWSILLGGPYEDYAYVSAVSDTGELYVSGRAGEGFPTTGGAFDQTFNGGIGRGPHDPTDAFVVKLSTEGKLIYSTYIGGSGDDAGRAIHLLPSGKLIVGSGGTSSTDLPTDQGTLPGPVLKPHLGGARDSYIAMLAADGGSLDFCTYFGPDDDDQRHGGETIRALGLDKDGNIWIGGTSKASGMQPTADAFQQVRGAGNEAYVAKLSIDGKKLLYFSWLGGNGPDEIETEGVSDAAGNFYIAGSTGSDDFPVTAGAFQSSLKGGTNIGWKQKIKAWLTGTTAQRHYADAWVAKVNNDGSLDFSTLYGGSTPGPEAFFGPAVGADGTVCATGRFRSDDLPVTAHALQPKKSGTPNTQDSVLACFREDGKELLYSSYFGGSGKDHGRHIAAGPDGQTFHIVGETRSRDLPLLNSPGDGNSSAFIAKFRLRKSAPAR
jgi:hypothetical protein